MIRCVVLIAAARLGLAVTMVTAAMLVGITFLCSSVSRNFVTSIIKRRAFYGICAQSFPPPVYATGTSFNAVVSVAELGSGK